MPDLSTEANTVAKQVSKADEELLEQIREDFRYCRDYWAETRKEMAKDMYFAAGIPPSDFTKDRADLPCVWPDELSQYLKQANNNLRQNPIAVQVNPRGSGATDKDAEHRGNYIRGIEYASNAQSVYTAAFESANSCSLGAWRIGLKVVSEEGHQEPRIKPVDSQFSVYFDPNAREKDFSDGEICFLFDTMRKKSFAKRFKGAVKKSFTADDYNTAPEWFPDDNTVTVAEYWHREQVGGEDSDEWKVMQYITNGVEILESTEWLGSWIPIIGVFGEELYTLDGGRTKRRFLSAIRRARPAQQMLAYIASVEVEEFQKAPRVPYMLYSGQELDDPEGWENAHRTPRAFLKVRPVPDPTNPGQVLPMPVRVPFLPNVQAYEVSRESWRRQIQASMGLVPLPTQAQRQNEKSGIALQRIQTQQAIGSFHFVDNLKRAIQNNGRQLNELITKLAETQPGLPQQVAVRDKQEDHKLLKVTTEEEFEQLMAQAEASGQQIDDDYLVVDRGEFDVTISTGPSSDSQREKADDFVDTIVANLKGLPIPPQIAERILGLAVRLKTLGPIGDEIADLLAPPQEQGNIPPQIQAQIAQNQAQMQQMQQQLVELTQEKQGKVVENQGKLAIEKEVTAREQLKIAANMDQVSEESRVKIAVAEITTKAQRLDERLAALEKLMMQMHGQAHELALQKDQQAHEQTMGQQQADQQAALATAEPAESDSSGQ